MTLQIQVEGKVTTRSGVNDAGRKWEIREQRALLSDTADPFNQIAFKVSLSDGQEPYQAGVFYGIGPASFKLGKYGELQVGRDLDLYPMEAGTKSAPLAKAS